MEEIASKWSSFSDVQQSGIATALAGTRQRENLITMFENWDLVEKYEQISANSYGTAAQKIEAYTDSVEAAKTRISTSVEKFVLSLNTTGVIKTFYNTIADLTSNMYSLATAAALLLLYINTNNLKSGLLGSVQSIGRTLTSLSLAGVKSGQRQVKAANNGGLLTAVNDSLISGQKESFSKSLSQTINSLDTLTESSQTILRDGMIPFQNSLIELDSSQKKEISAMLLREGQENQVAAERQRNIAAFLGQRTAIQSESITESVLGTINKEKQKEILAQIRGVQATEITEEQLQEALKNRATREEMAAKAIDESPDEVREEIGQNIRASGNITGESVLRDSVISVAGSSLGALFGANAGKLLGDGYESLGTIVGGIIGNSASSVIISNLAQGMSLTAAFTTRLGVLGPMLIALVGAAIVGGFKSKQESLKKELAETASEASTTYTETLNASTNAVTFDKLVTGVDYLGRNVSLTEDEYQEFLDASNALAEAFPELVVRTDELGNKLVGPDGLSGNIGKVTEKIDELTDSARQAADIALFKKEEGFLGIGENSGFSNVFDEQNDIIKKAKEEIFEKFGTFTFSDQIIEDKEKEVERIKEQKGTDSKEYTKAKTELDQLKLDRDAAYENIQAAKDTLAEYTDQLISYASTANGQADFGAEYADLYDNLEAMTDDQKTFVLSNIKLGVRGLEFENEQDFEEQVLSLTQKLTTFLQEHPVIADIYYGVGEFKTVGEQQDALQGLIEPLATALGADGYDESDKIIIENLGLKLVVGADGTTTIEVESTKDQIKAQFEKALGKELNWGDNTSSKWENFANSLTSDQYNQLYNMIGNGWIDRLSVNTEEGRDVLTRQINGGNYYTGTDAFLLHKAAAQKYEDYGTVDKEGHTSVGRDLLDKWSSMDGFKTMSKEEIAAEYADLGEDTWTQIESLNNELAELAGQGDADAYNEALTQGLQNIDLSTAEEGLSGKITALAQDVENLFPDIDVEGYIDTWEELKDAFASVKDMYDTLDTARKEQNATGKLSAETVLDMLAANEDYIQALTVEDEKIKLKTDAEEIMNKVRLETLQISLETQLQEEELEKAQLEAELAAIDNAQVWPEIQTEEIKTTNTAIEANNLYALSLAQIADEALNAADAINKKNLAEDGVIVNTDVSRHTENSTAAKNNQVEKIAEETLVDYSNTDETTKTERRNQIIQRLEQLLGTQGEDWTYDSNGHFTVETDKEGHYKGGNMGVQQHLLEGVKDIIENGSGSTDFAAFYDSYDEASDDTKDAMKDLLEALDAIIDKEWEAMEVWDEYNQKSTGYTAYFEKKRASLEKLAAYAKAEMLSAETEKEKADAEKDYIDYQKQINNLDDEEIEDKYNILELQGASLDKLVEMQKVYIQTADTEEENLERNQKLVELLHQQVELHREVSEWQRDNTDRLIERLSGNAYGNETYDRAIEQQIEAIGDEMADTQKQIQMYYAEAVAGYEKSGSTHAEALRLAYTGNSDYSQSLRDEMTKYYELIDKRVEYTIKNMEDKAEDLNKRLELIEKEKPEEWFKVEDINSYYTERMDLLQAQIKLYQETLEDTSDMTDEQIQNIVDSLNEATISLKEAQIDNLKDQTDLQSTQYDAIVYRINLWKDEIQDAIDAIEEAYEDEIKPIQDVSDELERQAELEDLLAAKKAAAKEKERVFRSGIGWVDKCTPVMDYIG